MSAPRGGRPLLSVAPMMDLTDRHFRRFARTLTRRTLLYTEMITTAAVLNGDRERLLGFSAAERPLALQLGGDDPEALAASARAALELGYDELDLNVGCPSERVQKGRFGACLMKDPLAVARAVEAMRAAVPLPVTVKHRIGVDDLDRFEHLEAFVRTVAEAGADRFVVHARKAWLSGLSPKENRTVPPLRYPEVYRLKELHPGLRIEINGGVRTLEEAAQHLRRVDGVMIGRAAYEHPYLLASADAAVFGEEAQPPTRREALAELLPYLESEAQRGTEPKRILRHVLGLFAGRPGARAFRRTLSEGMHRPGAGPELLLRALRAVPDEVSDERPPARRRESPPPASAGDRGAAVAALRG